MAKQKMLTIWFFVGIMLTVLGIIITATGIYFIFNPQTKTVLHEMNPNLWWGTFILIAGLLFFLSSLKKLYSEQN